MHRLVYISALLLLMGGSLNAKNGKLVVYLDVASFNAPAGQCYLETYMDVVGRSAVFLKDSNNKYQGQISVEVTFSQGDSIICANKYNLHSPQVDDTALRGDFVDVQRYPLRMGKYEMELTITDKNNPASSKYTLKQKINVGHPRDSIYISDAEFLQSFTAAPQQQSPLFKNGYVMVPYVFSYYPTEVKDMNFYVEVYNTKQVLGANEKVILRYFLESYETHGKLFEFNSTNVKPTDTIVPLLGGFNIDKLPAGNYYLVLQVIDKNNKVLTSHSYAFLRQNKNMEISMKDLSAINVNTTFVNKIANKDTLVDYIKSLWPISNFNEREFIKDNDFGQTDFTLLKQYFYNFWASRDPMDPEGGWKKYLVQVKYVNKEFKTFSMKGYETDRGRVYLQYGVPDQRVKSSINPSSYPYEIWEYYRLNDGEVDRKFVFYEPDLVTNNYELLHSTARGEIQNRQWQVILNSTSGTPGNIDQNTITDPFGENTLDDYSNPR